MTGADDNWTAGDAYESYMGRWSRPLARAFVGWLGSPPGAHWLDVGCGTGALTGAIVVAGAEALPGGPGAFDCVASGLLLNFLADPARAVGLMRERLRRRGMVAAYVWDYGDGIEFLRCFWDEAVALDSTVADLDEGRRFSFCRPETLTSLAGG